MEVNTGKIKSNEWIATSTYAMEIESTLGTQLLPGQFVNVKIDGYTLRRPISIAAIEADGYKLIYKVVGAGTRIMSEMKPGQELDVIGPLGNPFPIFNDEKNILIIGGGVGVPPLMEVARRYRKNNTKVYVVLGFNDRESIFGVDEFEEMGCYVFVATMDGSVGTRGTVIECINMNDIPAGKVYACGPTPMLRAVENAFTDGYVSLESRMACGIGACMGCVVHDKNDKDKYYRVCKDGPVFEIGKVEI